MLAKKSLALLLTVVIIGLMAGYGLSFAVYNEQTADLKTQIKELKKTAQLNLANLQSQFSETQGDLSQSQAEFRQLITDYQRLANSHSQAVTTCGPACVPPHFTPVPPFSVGAHLDASKGFVISQRETPTGQKAPELIIFPGGLGGIPVTVLVPFDNYTWNFGFYVSVGDSVEAATHQE